MKLKSIVFILIIALLVSFVTASSVSAQDPSAQDLPGSGWFATFTLQNAATSGTANFSLDANASTRTSSSTDADAANCSVGAGASVIYNPKLAPGGGSNRIGFANDCGSAGTDNLADGFEGGVVVQSDAPLAAVVSVGNNPTGTASAFYQGIDSSLADTTISFPVAKAGFGTSTTFYIQAVEDADVTVSYSAISGTAPANQNFQIPAGRTYVVNVPGSGFFGAATATSTTGRIVGSVIEHPDSSPAGFALSTRAFSPGDADETVLAPTIKNDFFGAFTAMVVQAVGGNVTVDVTFSKTAGSGTCAGTTTGVTINDGESANFGGPNDVNLPSGFGDGCFGSAVVTVTGGTGEIVATVNENQGGTSRAVYSAFGASNATQSVAVPLVKEDFFGGNTAVVVQAVGDSSSSTTITAEYVTANGGGPCTTASACTGIEPNGGNAGDNPVAGGSAVNFRRLNQNSSEYTGGTIPTPGTNNAMIVSSSSLPVVAIAQEAVTGLDVKNYEGFSQ